jgi:hypothetical protein
MQAGNVRVEKSGISLSAIFVATLRETSNVYRIFFE